MKNSKQTLTDLEECQMKIMQLLKEHNCRLFSSDEVHHVILEDNDTHKSVGFDRLH